ncbi:RNA exonuclease 3 [Candida viswanathii]|uniref:RNA exonuclease 3 n=1 Tax=Candida viswanathii TaxID=5486 RepID=A0A367YF02_9ASCO|nr:RNA exonuclease 3 [Candida viswanathii]
MKADNKRKLEEADATDTKKPKLEDPKYILPKQVNTNPATLPERKKNIELIVGILLKKNPSTPTPKLKATEIEYDVAKKSSNVTYKNQIRQAVYKLQHPPKTQPAGPTKEQQEAEEYQILKEWVIDRDKLIKYGYAMDVPEAKPDDRITRVCSRCGTEFRLSQQLEPTTCEYHHGKRQRGKYLCCMANASGAPCTKSKHHVYLLQSPEQKQALQTYRFTKDMFRTPSKWKVIGLDCEMIFTTEGFELARITAIDYFTRLLVCDIFVKPFGQPVDFNTRYSGIRELDDKFLSWDAAMEKLGEAMDSETIVLVHGGDNDFHAIRAIHNNIIDTSVLFPSRHETGPRSRWSLRDLTFKYLSKEIQRGEHDSTEDALATADIVRFFVDRELKRRRAKWTRQ